MELENGSFRGFAEMKTYAWKHDYNKLTIKPHNHE
jgi:hypothetical protein